MKIGVLSDTHKKTALSQDIITQLLNDGAEFFIHAGDIVKTENLDQLKNSGKKYVAVYGNNDAHLVEVHNQYNLQQEPHLFKLAKTTFKLMHLPYYMSPDTEIVIFGHTHEFECDFKNGTLFLNPGEACARNDGRSECVLLEVTPDEFKIKHYSKKPKDQKYKTQKFCFEREVS